MFCLHPSMQLDRDAEVLEAHTVIHHDLVAAATSSGSKKQATNTKVVLVAERCNGECYRNKEEQRGKGHNWNWGGLYRMLAMG